MDPRLIQLIIDLGGDPNNPDDPTTARVLDMRNRLLFSPDEIIEQFTGPAPTILPPAPGGGGFAPQASAGEAFPELGFDPGGEVPQPSAADLIRQNPEAGRRVLEGFARSPLAGLARDFGFFGGNDPTALGGTDGGLDPERLSALLESGGFEFAGFNPDGTIRAFHAETGGFFNVDVEGGNLTVLGEADRSGGGAGGRAPTPQFVGTDPRTGEALFFDPNVPGIVRGEQIGFAGIDPEREFELQEAARRQAELEFANDVISGGGDFLFREAFGAGLVPDRGFVGAEDILGQLLTGRQEAAAGGAGGTGFDFEASPLGRGLAEGTIPGFAAESFVPQTGGTAGAESEAARLRREGALFGAGVADVNPATQTGLAELSRESPGTIAARTALGGEGFVSTASNPFRTTAPSEIFKLTDAQREAAGTASLRELNTPFEDIEQNARLNFFAPSSARGRARVV
jgi:hypothetical protein